MTRWLLLLLVACGEGAPDPGADADTGDTGPQAPPPIDLVTPLGPGEVRAGVITDPAASVGGLVGEARPGDVLLVNDRARFVIQGMDRQTGGLVGIGGHVIDADVVRTDGTVDADLVVDWRVGLDVGWLPEPVSVTVVDDGLETDEAVVRVEAVDRPFAYLEAFVEDDGLYEPRGLTVSTTYTLRPDSPFLEVTTTVTAGDAPETLRPGDVLQAVQGVTSRWTPGVGRLDVLSGVADALLVVHDGGGPAVGLFAPDADGSATLHPGFIVLDNLAGFGTLYESAVELDAGASHTSTFWRGVGRSAADLLDAWQALRGVATRDATVDVGVPGVRVTAVIDDAPFTQAWTGPDGTATVQVPEAAAVRWVADGHGTGLIDDLPVGAGDVAPLAHATRRTHALDALRDGTPGAGIARGYGRAEGPEGRPLALTPPGTLRVTSGATDAFQVRVRRTDADVPDDAFGPEPPRGLAALAHARTGSIDVPLEPGTYDVQVWHGTRFEVHAEAVTIASGQAVDLAATDLVRAFDAPGWWLADTHIHAIPSFDGKITPTTRALELAAVGVDVWFASEHDVAVDHGPTVEALDLADVLRPVGSVEVTPWIRGHVNIFPNTAQPDARAGGAWPWWEHLADETTTQFDRLLDAHPGVLVQVNHPFSPGLPALAGWSPGVIDDGDLWWDGFDAIEVIVPGETPLGFDVYVDLADRGIVTAATGSTDSHEPMLNDPGLWATWVHVPEADTAGAITDADLVAAFEQGRTVATNGPLVVLDPLPGSVVTGGPLTATVHAPSWMPVDRLELWRDGVLADEVDVSGDPVATFDLDADRDGTAVVVARGDDPMRPFGGRRAWAVTSALLIDVDGDGWTPPKPPLVVK